MADESVLKNKFTQGYASVFYEQWPALTGGLLLGSVQYSDRGLVTALGHRGGNPKLGRLAFLRARPVSYPP